jgi:hypothetical protein
LLLLTADATPLNKDLVPTGDVIEGTFSLRLAAIDESFVY